MLKGIVDGCMDVFTPVLKVLLYIVGLVVVGTKLFDLHFESIKQ